MNTEALHAIGQLLHIIETWEVSEQLPRERAAGYRQMLAELQHLPQLDHLRILAKKEGDQLKRRRPNDRMIESIYAWIVRSRDGSEGVVGVARSREELESSRHKAESAAATLYASIHAAEFVRRE